MQDDNDETRRANLRATLRHLAIFDRDTFLFRMLADGANNVKRPPRYLTGTIKQHYKELWYANRRGYGIFVQPNASDGKDHKHANIVSAPCFYVDLDEVPIENLDRFPVPPHLILETSPGKYHAYWRVADIPLDCFSDVQARLAALIGSDHRITDLPRIMRLAGFYHLKNPENPYPVRIIERP